MGSVEQRMVEFVLNILTVVVIFVVGVALVALIGGSRRRE